MATKTALAVKNKRQESDERPALAPVDADEMPALPPVDLNDPSYYVNRELSSLAFQWRVLEEAQDDSNPPLERVFFLSIVGSNLDEFFMVRVAGLMRQVDSGVSDEGPDAMSAAEQLDAIRKNVGSLLASAHRCFRRQLLPSLEANGIHLLGYAELTERQRAKANAYFDSTVFPVLTPLAFDPGHPFPHISNLSLNLAVLIRDDKGEEHFARVKIPDTLPQLVPIERPPRRRAAASAFREQSFIWLEDLMAANLHKLFPGMEIVEAHPFHITRNADMEATEGEAEDLLELTEEGIRQRRFGAVVRLQVNVGMSSRMLKILVTNLEIEPECIYKQNGPLSFGRLRHLVALNRPDLKWTPFLPALPPAFDPENEDEDIFATLRRGDILLHHPFESFQPIIDLVQKAAVDPGVLAIKITLYRVGRNAPVVQALVEAMEVPKQVAAVVELKARFDEESNIGWARALEQTGAHVSYGLVGLKVHCKVLLIVRREGDNIRRYVHVATGNYNAATAHLYTDLGMLTTDPEIAADVTDLFNYLTGYSAKADYRKLLVAPTNLRRKFSELIEREIEHQRKHGNGRLIFKMNALVDRKIIRLLYHASQAGIKVDLLCRGICCLRPGIPGVSENIRVISIVGRFLEHSRIYYFHNNGDEQIYLGSSDLMPRNLNRRVEVLFPVQDPQMIRHLHDDILGTYLADNVKSREMRPDGSYVRRRARPGEPRIGAQNALLAKLGSRPENNGH
jgi:polyphosphate kinase